MKNILRFLFQAVCLLLMAVGLVGALLPSFFVSAMLIVWFQEGTLQITDQKMLWEASKWLLGSCTLVGLTWWLRRKIVGDNTRDDSFRLVESTSDTSQEIVQNVSDLILLGLLAIWLWALIPGSAITKIAAVAGWLAVAFLGMHTRIVLHEIGHLAAARLVDLKLRKIQVGVGPLLWSRSFANGLLCEWRAWPQGGFVLAPDRKTEGFRTRQSLCLVAGPLADLVILWSTYQLITRAFGGLGAAFAQSACGLIVFALFWWTALSAVGGLVPHKVWIDHHKLWTDGHLLLRLRTGSNLGFPELAYNSNWRGPLELLGPDCSRSAIPLEVVKPESPAHRAGPLTFHEQRALLSSRLLRKASFTSSPLA